MKLALTSMIVVSLWCVSSQADLVYRLVDHGIPEHSVSGTISVLDSAADDGLLSPSEVVSWSISVVGSAVNFSATSVNGVVDTPGVHINSDEIFVGVNATPRNAVDYFEFGTFNRYIDANLEPSGFGSVIVSESPFGASLQLPYAARIHAIRVVPEPVFCPAAVLGIVGAVLRRRRKRTRARLLTRGLI